MQARTFKTKATPHSWLQHRHLAVLDKEGEQDTPRAVLHVCLSLEGETPPWQGQLCSWKQHCEVLPVLYSPAPTKTGTIKLHRVFIWLDMDSSIIILPANMRKGPYSPSSHKVYN